VIETVVVVCSPGSITRREKCNKAPKKTQSSSSVVDLLLLCCCLEVVQWLLTEGGSNITEKDTDRLPYCWLLSVAVAVGGISTKNQMNA
jgi:hypothetical protein